MVAARRKCPRENPLPSHLSQTKRREMTTQQQSTLEIQFLILSTSTKNIYVGWQALSPPWPPPSWTLSSVRGIRVSSTDKLGFNTNLYLYILTIPLNLNTLPAILAECVPSLPKPKIKEVGLNGCLNVCRQEEVTHAWQLRGHHSVVKFIFKMEVVSRRGITSNS